MIRVLNIITRLDVGGSTDTVLLLVTRLPQAQFRCHLISGPTLDPPPDLSESLSQAGVRWTQVRHLRRSVAPIADACALAELTRTIRTLAPDIVNTHTSKAGFLGRLAARLAGVPRILHTPHGHIFHGYFSPAATRCFIALERWAARFTDRIIALTDAEAAQHLALGIGRPDQFVTIPSGVDLVALRAAAGDGPQLRRSLGVADDAPLLGAVSRLVPIKGLQHLIAAMPEILRRFPDAHLAIAGDGEERAALEAQAAALGVAPRVRFLGFRRDPGAVIACLDVFVLPSLNEGLGKVLVEAMGLGVPVVATRVGGVPDVVEDGRQGLLVPPADPAALAKGVAAILEDRPRAAAMGEAGMARARLFSAEVTLQRYAALYRGERR